jgi:hypothetical protein
MNKIILLDELIRDEKKIDRTLYSSGPYWSYKNKCAIFHIKKRGLKDFRGQTGGIGTSFADNLTIDFRDELNTKGRLIEKVEVEIDHFHNAHSFVEMPKKVIKNYAKFIKNFKTKEMSLISYGNFDIETTFDPEELNDFFGNKLKISYESYLIEEYNKKLIYLTSK